MTNPLIFPNSIDDPTHYDVRRGIPIFCEHTRTHVLEKGADPVLRTIDGPYLERIAAVSNARNAKGTLSRLTDGHANFSGEPNAPQPTLTGFQSNFRVEPNANGEPWLYCDWHVKREYSHLLPQRPFRSAEYNPVTDEIEGTAMLITAPYLPIGTTTFSGTSVPTLYGAIPMADPADNPTDGGSTAPTAYQMTDEDKPYADALWAYFLSANPKLGQLLADPAPAPAPANANAATLPGPTANSATTVPTAYAAEMSSLTERLAAMERTATESQVDAALSRLASQRVAFNPATERIRMIAMNGEARAAHENLMATCYSRVPGVGPTAYNAGPVEGVAPGAVVPLSSSQLARAATISHKRGVSLDEASRIVRQEDK